MEASHLVQNHWFIDGAFAVHDDMKSHSGSYMTFGKGMMNGSSNKQKINVMSSTEGELVGAHKILPTTLWSRYFIEAQGYDVEQMTLYQDNQATMRLEVNSRFSSTK